MCLQTLFSIQALLRCISAHMSEASGPSSQLPSALSLFSKKAPATSIAASCSGDKQGTQKRLASKRNTILATAPAKVQEKWATICALKGRTGAKNAEKTKFTELILKDTKFDDVYWQTDVTDTYSRTHRMKETWMLRSKVDTEHGGGAQGHEEVQQAIDAGLYKTRFITTKTPQGKPLRLEEVCVPQEEGMQGRTATLATKVRAGGKSTELQFKAGFVGVWADTCEAEAEKPCHEAKIVRKRPASIDLTDEREAAPDAPEHKRGIPVPRRKKVGA